KCYACLGEEEPELQITESSSDEHEAGPVVHLDHGTFFRRVYSDHFSGTLSHGQQIGKEQWIATIESSSSKRESLIVSDIKVKIFQETAIATCLWSSRLILTGQHVSSQIRAIHVYVNTPRGCPVVPGETAHLTPDLNRVLQ